MTGRAQAAVAAAACALFLSGCGGGSESADGTVPTAAAPPAAASAITASTEVRRPPPRLRIRAGTVTVEPGPFTDRVELSELRLERSPGPAVRGRLRNSVDVSELIVLELQADFYDRDGRYLGSGQQVFEDAHAGPGEPPLRFAITPGDRAMTASSALLSIPQLVNE